jgi:cytochrome c1
VSRAGYDKGGLRQKPDVDHAYNLPRLHRIFFWSSLVSLLVMILWVVKIDYDRDWKRHQREFNRLTAEQTRKAIEAEDKRLAGGSGKQRLEKAEAALAQAGADLKVRQAETDGAAAALRRAQDAFYKADQANRGTRALYDAFRYEYEKVRHEVEAGHAAQSKLEKAQHELDELDRKRGAAGLAFEEASAAVAAAEAQLGALMQARDAAQKDRDALFSNRRRLENRLAGLQTGFVNVVRNSPVLDFMIPSIKVNQTVHEDLRFDVNYQTVPRVDRCTTCHLGIDKKGYEDAPQPYTTHPNLDLFLSSKSPHKLEDIGCTVCHSGWDRSTDFNWAAHMPSDSAEAARWHHERGWHTLHKWDEPMLPMQYVQGQCYKCHTEDVQLAGAPVFNQGRELFERVGCWSCHKVEGKLGPKMGPSLRSLQGKTTQDWVRRWIEDPVGFRPTTLMPAFFNQPNTSDDYSLRRNELEVAAITDYLFAKSDVDPLKSMPAAPGNPVRGKQLVESVGCMGCHLVGTDTAPPADHIRRQYGPNLMGLAAKTSAAWVYSWIKDPKAMYAETRMPNLRLTDQEANDITAYLMSVPAPSGWGSQALEEPAAQLLDEVTLEYLQTTLSKHEATKRLAQMTHGDKRLFLGEKLIGRYGCYACHDLPGFEKAEPIGVELTGEGSKIIAKFDFGLQHQVPHTRWDWISTKVREPRIWDVGLVKPPQDKLKMPKFNLSPAQVTAVTSFVLGLTKDEIPATRRQVYDPHEMARNHGLRLVADRNCMGCHQLRDFGGDYASLVADPSMAPPLLTPTGAKVQPEWLHDFLQSPTTIRDWLEVRMPTFGFDESQTTTLVNMFQGISRVENRYPRFDAAAATPASIEHGRALFGIRGSSNYDASLKCNSCHPAGNVLPTSPVTQWGPNLALAHQRLQPNWVVDWLRNPQAIQPGTRMPNFFYDGDTKLTDDPERDMRDVRNYLWTLRDPGRIPSRVSQR